MGKEEVNAIKDKDLLKYKFLEMLKKSETITELQLVSGDRLSYVAPDEDVERLSAAVEMAAHKITAPHLGAIINTRIGMIGREVRIFLLNIDLIVAAMNPEMALVDEALEKALKDTTEQISVLTEEIDLLKEGLIEDDAAEDEGEHEGEGEGEPTDERNTKLFRFEDTLKKLQDKERDIIADRETTSTELTLPGDLQDIKDDLTLFAEAITPWIHPLQGDAPRKMAALEGNQDRIDAWVKKRTELAYPETASTTTGSSSTLRKCGYISRRSFPESRSRTWYARPRSTQTSYQSRSSRR